MPVRWELADFRGRRIAAAGSEPVKLDAAGRGKCKYTLPLPEEFRHAGVKPDDDYLVQAQRACPEATIVTTDHPLAAILDKHGVPWRFRDDFLRDYLR